MIYRMFRIQTYRYTLATAWQQLRGCKRRLCRNRIWLGPALILMFLAGSCTPEPPLHLFVGKDVELELMLEFELEAYWDYFLENDKRYNWRDEWYYGFDDNITPDLGVDIDPDHETFSLRRYYTGTTPYGPHTQPEPESVYGRFFSGTFWPGFWDILVWNEANSEGTTPVLILEDAPYDSVYAETTMTQRTARYQAPKYTRAFNQPEMMFSAYKQAEEIKELNEANLSDYYYDEDRHKWVKRLKMPLLPVTYVYLTQVILRHNTGTYPVISAGASDLSGMAKSTNLNTGNAGLEPITVDFSSGFKKECLYKNGEVVSIAGGKVLTFGICGENGYQIHERSDVKDGIRHYLDVNLGYLHADTTLIFDVTDQVRNRWKGGVITVELDMDTIPVPSGRGGSAFDATVEDWKYVTYPPDEDEGFGL